MKLDWKQEFIQLAEGIHFISAIGPCVHAACVISVEGLAIPPLPVRDLLLHQQGRVLTAGRAVARLGLAPSALERIAGRQLEQYWILDSIDYTPRVYVLRDGIRALDERGLTKPIEFLFKSDGVGPKGHNRVCRTLPTVESILAWVEAFAQVTMESGIPALEAAYKADSEAFYAYKEQVVLKAATDVSVKWRNRITEQLGRTHGVQSTGANLPRQSPEALTWQGRLNTVTAATQVEVMKILAEVDTEAKAYMATQKDITQVLINHGDWRAREEEFRPEIVAKLKEIIDDILTGDRPFRPQTISVSYDTYIKPWE